MGSVPANCWGEGLVSPHSCQSTLCGSRIPVLDPSLCIGFLCHVHHIHAQFHDENRPLHCVRWRNLPLLSLGFGPWSLATLFALCTCFCPQLAMASILRLLSFAPAKSMKMPCSGRMSSLAVLLWNSARSQLWRAWSCDLVSLGVIRFSLISAICAKNFVQDGTVPGCERC